MCVYMYKLIWCAYMKCQLQRYIQPSFVKWNKSPNSLLKHCSEFHK